MRNKTLTFAAFLLTGTLFFSGCGQASSANTGGSDNASAAATETSETDSSSQANAAGTGASSAQTDSVDDGVFSSLSTTDLNGNTIDASTFSENKLTLVNAWNIGCTPCINELPALEQLSSEYAGKGVAIKGLYFNFAEDISNDEMSQINDALATANATYPQLVLTKEMYDTDTMQGVMAFPTTFIVDSNGNIIDKLEGSNDYDGWKEIIEKYLTQVQ